MGGPALSGWVCSSAINCHSVLFDADADCRASGWSNAGAAANSGGSLAAGHGVAAVGSAAWPFADVPHRPILLPAPYRAAQADQICRCLGRSRPAAQAGRQPGRSATNVAACRGAGSKSFAPRSPRKPRAPRKFLYIFLLGALGVLGGLGAKKTAEVKFRLNSPSAAASSAAPSAGSHRCGSIRSRPAYRFGT